jgi:hypothetical protein
VAPNSVAVPKHDDQKETTSVPGSAAVVSRQTPVPPPDDPGERKVTADRDEAPSTGFFYRIAVAQVIGNLAGSVSTALVFGAVLLVAVRQLRRHGGPSGLLPGPSGTVNVGVPTEPRLPAPLTRLEAAGERQAPLPDFSLRYEARRQGREASGPQPEAAVLRLIFEQNLRLREQLAELEESDPE